MKTIIADINRKTDNRFVYAIGVFCLLSICLSQFPEAQVIKSKKEKKEIIMASNVSKAQISSQIKIY